jgi:TfoX/Sxy family transcriptional regulator of competence genes
MSDTSFLDYVLEQLEGAKGLKTRGMFGGTGLYMGQSFFGIVHKGALYLRTDEASRPAYVKAGSRPFNPKGRAALLRAPVQDSTGGPARGAGRIAGKVAQPPSSKSADSGSGLLHRYYEVPAHVLEDSEELLVWAKTAAKTQE